MSDENEQSHDKSSHQYGSVVEELDQMLKQNKSDIQKSDHAPKQIHESEKLPKEDKSQPQHVGSNSATGIEEFDELLDGGFPKGAVVLLAGSSGSGKTIFASQWLFEGVKNNENGVYVTLTEPLFKILENLEKMSYYDREAIEQEKLKIIDLRDTYSGKGFNPKEILDFIEEQVKQTNAKRLCIDSITAIAYHYNDKSQIRTFIFELGKILATLGCTTILTSEVPNPDRYSMYEVEEFIADAILRLDQIKVKDEFQRAMRIVKVRGKSYKAETIPLKITADGIMIFPKTHSPLEHHSTGERISTGNPVLDDMLMGGYIQGSTTLTAGSTGTGKTLLSLQFIMDGLKKGETCLYAGFEESKDQLLRNAKSFGWDLKEYEEKGLLTLRCVYPSDKLLEEHFKDIKQIVEDRGVKRCVVDSLSSISHAFNEDKFSSFAIRLNGFLKVKDITSFFTTTTGTLIGSATLEEGNLSTLTDSIVMLRYVEMQGKLESVINILKMRGSSHCKYLRKYEITDEGVVIGSPLSNYEGVMTGSSKKIHELEEEGEELKKIIKEKEEMEKELVESEERFRDISQNMGDWVWETNEKGEYTFASGKVKEILGYAPSELIGMTLLDLMPEDEVTRVGEIFKKLVSEEKPIIDLENWNLTKEGKKVCLITSGRPLLDESGRLVGYRGVDKDITERKQKEEKLEEAEKILKIVNKNLERKVEERTAELNVEEVKYQVLLENIPQKIFHKNKNLEYVYSNENFARDFNLVPNEIIGKTDYDLYPKEFAERYQANDKRIIETGATEEITEKFFKDGQEFDVDVIKTPIKDDQDKVIGVLGIFLEKKKVHDIQERHSFEAENSVGGDKDD